MSFWETKKKKKALVKEIDLPKVAKLGPYGART